MKSILLAITILLGGATAWGLEDSNEMLFTALSPFVMQDSGMGRTFVSAFEILCRRSNNPREQNRAVCNFRDGESSRAVALKGQDATKLFDALLASGLPAEPAAGSSYISAEEISCFAQLSEIDQSNSREFTCTATVELPLKTN